MDARTAVGWLAAIRVAVGLGLLGAPERTAAGWLGRKVVTSPGGRIAVQGVAIRDLVAGAGVLAALAADADDDELARWVAASVVADGADAVSVLVSSRRGTGPRVSAGVALAAATAGALSLAALRRR
ncbi:MAG: hypothetical protein R6V28_06990 [Nitriliruptoraceae bacterium]